MRFPAIVSEKDGVSIARFKRLSGCEARARTPAGLLKGAQDALDRWLASELAAGRTPPHPPKGVHLLRRESLLWVPVAPRVAVPVLIRWARTEAGLTQADLARRLRVSQPRIARLELPASNPSLKTMSRVAAALNLRLEVAFLPPPP
jgi:DNA-binding XRE family transcriptional regulator/predicted RNase H-like HicB family nuclease